MASPFTVWSTGPRRTVPEQPVDEFVVADVLSEPREAKLPVPVLNDAASAVAASYRVLVHRLERQMVAQVVAVTSPGAGEGKSALAINLAAALAERGGGRVLLVEANRWRPALAAGLGLTVPECFDLQLARATSEAPMTWATVAVGGDRLQVLAMDPTRAGGELVSPSAYRRLLDRARQDYGHVILDCASVADGADVTVLEDLADGSLLALRGKKTRASEVRHAVQQLSPARLLGVVLTGGKV